MLVYAPRGRDGVLVARVIDAPDVTAAQAPDARALVAALDAPDVGAVVLTQEAIPELGRLGVRGTLDRQPEWSEVPVVVFADPETGNRRHLKVLDALGERCHITVLDRPVGMDAFRSVVALAVRERRQQYAVRDLLGEVRAFNSKLQDRVDAQTEALRRRAAEVEALAHAITRTERRERERIALLLHDDVQQVLFGLRIQMELVAKDGNPEAVERAIGYIDDVVRKTRLLSTDLYPPMLDDDGLAEALGWIADTMRERFGMTVHLDVGSEAEAPPAVLEVFVRAARECLFNVVKHAGTTEAWVRTWGEDGHVRLSVRDDGRGGDLDGTGGLGMADLRGRVSLLGGHFEATSVPGEGTRVEVAMPNRVPEA